jgi:hypothetical protein
MYDLQVLVYRFRYDYFWEIPLLSSWSRYPLYLRLLASTRLHAAIAISEIYVLKINYFGLIIQYLSTCFLSYLRKQSLLQSRNGNLVSLLGTVINLFYDDKVVYWVLTPNF